MIQDLYSLIQDGFCVSIDSRNIGKRDIFFALKGENFDGNRFAENAIRNGAKYAVVDNENFAKDSRYILFSDVLKTLQELATMHRKSFNIPVIGITGSNGKTTTKELINAILRKKFNTLATKGNLNNHIGVPLMLLSLKKDHTIAVIEMGANHVGEIAELCQIAKPTHGIITNIGKAHLEGFEDIDGVVKAKKALYDHLEVNKGTAFVNKDDALLMQLSAKVKRTLYSRDKPSKCKAVVKKSTPLIELECFLDDEKFELSTHLYGSYNVYNILAAICTASHFDTEIDTIKNALSGYMPDNNRSQLIKTRSNTIFLDAYNANPTSMSLAIKSFSEIPSASKVFIAGDMLELGAYSRDEHKIIIDLLKVQNFQHVYLVGKEFSTCSENPFTSFHNVAALYNYVKKNSITNSSIYIKGSRGIQLEKIVDLL